MKNDAAEDGRVTRSESKKRKKDSRDGRSKASRPNQPSPQNYDDVTIPRIIVPANMINPREHMFSRSEEQYLSTLKERERGRLIQEMQQGMKKTTIPLRFRVLKSSLPQKYELMRRMQSSCEGGKFDTWLESLLSIPIGKLAPPPIDSMSAIGGFLKDTRAKMDSMIYGQYEAKDEIMRLLCQWSATGGLNSFAIALEGPPGIGKTTFAKNVISQVMNRPFKFISLGGATDSAYLMGHSYTYEGAIHGRIVEAVKTAQVMNPCLYFDELDKISKTPKGDEISNILVHLTDREQNCHFNDRYFHGIDLDLSQALLVFSYNFPKDVNPVLMDRLNIIKFKPPDVDEKVQIAKLHLLPKAMRESGMSKESIQMSDEAIEYVIRAHTDELGVRNLEKALCKIMSTCGVLVHAPNVLSSLETASTALPLVCNQTLVDEILGVAQRDDSHLFMYT